MDTMQRVCDALTEMGATHALIRHPAVYTIEDMERLGIFQEIHICKNLFLCDDKGRVYFLVVLRGNRRADLGKLALELGVKKLRFASEEKLGRVLGLAKGAVSPLGVLNDSLHQVTVVLDKGLLPLHNLGVHPNDNTGTVVLSGAALLCVLEHWGGDVLHLDMDA